MFAWRWSAASSWRWVRVSDITMVLPLKGGRRSGLFRQVDARTGAYWMCGAVVGSAETGSAVLLFHGFECRSFRVLVSPDRERQPLWGRALQSLSPSA